jgi:hypothetical protein
VSEEILISLPPSVRPVHAVRSTLIQSSLHTLRERGYYERYLTFLDVRYKDKILGTLAPEWLPLEVASAHYAACDSLRLSEEQLRDVGESVGNRIQGTFIGTLVKKARTVGLTPWIPLGHFQRLWERLMQGGGVSLVKKGPKDAVVDIRGLGLLRYEYFRSAFCGVIASAIKLGAGRSATVRVSDLRNVEARILFKASWV